MPKTSQQIINMIEIARKNGVSKQGGYDARYFEEDRIFVLSHYGTKIIQINGTEVVKLGGYSTSDAAAISTVLGVYNYHYYVTNNPKHKNKSFGEMDGWLLIRNQEIKMKLKTWWKKHWDETLFIISTVLFIVWILKSIGTI